MNIPEDLKYTKDHEWVKVEGNTGTVGITDFAQKELGDIVFVEIETEGQTLDKEATFGTIEAVKTVADLYMPIGGKVSEGNKDLEGNPELVNQDPYGKGWIAKMEIKDEKELNDLIDSAAYKTHINA